MKKIWIIILVVLGVLVLVGIGVLIWYLLRTEDPYVTIHLEGGLGDVEQHAAFTRIPNAGDMFWWFYPSQSAEDIRPIILWLDGVTDLPPSLAANIGTFGPYDFNLNRRNDSWVEDYNLLFVDAPLGTGFSTVESEDFIPGNVEENAEHLFLTLRSFYDEHPSLLDIPLYVFGQGHGAQLALALVLRLQQDDASTVAQNLRGVALGNGIIEPGIALTKLGFYLEELGYIYAPGRDIIETLAAETQEFISNGQLSEAFENFASLGDVVNEAGAVAVNLRHIVEKLTDSSDTFRQAAYLKSIQQIDGDLTNFMNGVVAPALGIEGQYDGGRAAVLRAFADSFMKPAASLVEEVLQTTDLVVTIYNGNLDAVSNTPGQLEWVERLQWDGQAGFLQQPRQLLVLDQQLEGYFRRTDRLTFYWINVAGQSVPLDNPKAMRRVLASVVGEN